MAQKKRPPSPAAAEAATAEDAAVADLAEVSSPGDTLPGRVSLRALYASAVTAVNADPAAAVADYQSFLSNLVEARRKRGD